MISFSQDMPKPLQPNFVLDVEASELFIQAGLQDRVIQVSPAPVSTKLCVIHSMCYMVCVIHSRMGLHVSVGV